MIENIVDKIKGKPKSDGCRNCGSERFFLIHNTDHPIFRRETTKRNKRHHRTDITGKKQRKYVFFSRYYKQQVRVKGFQNIRVSMGGDKMYECQGCGAIREI